MVSIPDNVRQDLVTFVPSALLKEITCFVFYDNHPRNKKYVDIIICTSRGELKEFFKRDLINSIVINSCWKPKHIHILRNIKGELFYLVSYKDEIAILSSREKLKVLHKIVNVDTYEVDDLMCRGKARLKIILKDDAVPLFFDNNFDKLEDRTEMINEDNADDSLPIITQLARKLTEAKYSVKCNEKVLDDISKTRQLVAYSTLKRCSSAQEEAIYQEDKLDLNGLLKIKSHTPLIKMCNKKIAVILEVINKDKLVAENVHILFHTSQVSTVYTTKVFDAVSSSPYWKENLSNTIATSNTKTAIVAGIDLEETKYNVSSKICLCGAISYKIGSREHLLPFDDTYLSSLDTMSESFNLLSTIQDSNNYDLLALLACSEKTELCLRHIKMDNEKDQKLKLLDEFCRNLNMEHVLNVSNVVVHKSSPYNILHGVMIIEKELIGEDKWIISLYTRSKDQILAFIHIMHDAVPYRIVATTTNQQIKSKIPQLSSYDEYTSVPSKYVDCSGFQSSMFKQTSMILEYLDECMIKMNESKNPVVQNKMGSEIDIFAGGGSRFQEFSTKIKEEAARGVNSICTCGGQSEGMDIDLD